jgi:parallel beta-helix repeat protein
MIDKDSYNNTFWGNEISYNTLAGVHIKGPAADNNLFYKNYFKNNTPIARDDNPNSNWNTSNIGNYWGDYDGEDVNGDGIGDTPYTIPGNAGSTDYLPIWDIAAPIITINSPNPNDVFGLIAPSFDVSIIEQNLDEMWYTLDNGLHNYTFEENNTIDQSAWDATPFGSITLSFYARDKIGYVGSADVIILKEEQALTITINSPNDGDVFGSKAPDFDITVEVPDLDKIWYIINGSGQLYLKETLQLPFMPMIQLDT